MSSRYWRRFALISLFVWVNSLTPIDFVGAQSIRKPLSAPTAEEELPRQ